MTESFPIVKCSIETLDRTLYAAREVGDLVDSGNYILNTALYYSFGFASGKYVNFGNTPDYIEDTQELFNKIYITPASMGRLLENSYRCGGHSTSQWNARSHLYIVKNWKATDKDDPSRGKNIPKFGKERVINQQNIFTSFIIPYGNVEDIISKIPKYARLGKKKSKIKIKTEIIESFVDEGEFITNHPFGIYDYEGLPLGDFISVRMRPIPLVIQGRYKGKFIKIPYGSGKNDVFLPYGLKLLKVKR